MLRLLGIAILSTVIALLSACGAAGPVTQQLAEGGGGGALDPVVVTPAAIGQIWQGTTTRFSANVPVSWSVLEGGAGGNIDATGLYTAPHSAGTFTVVAKALGDPTATAKATVQVVPVTISISPSSETLRVAANRQFTGFALAADPGVTWQLQEGVAAGSITADGVYTAPMTTGTFHLIATSVFDASVSTTAPVTVVATGFTALPDMATARFEHTATLLSDGRVLVAGGTADAAHSAELFLPVSSSFAPTSGGMVHVRSGHCSALLNDGRVLIAGGGSNDVLFTTAELFDPATGTFTPAAELNQPRTGATATVVAGGKVLIAGGEDSGGNALSSAELYDPATGSFTFTGNMQLPRSQHTATLLADGKVLLLGNKDATAGAEIYDPATGFFAATGSMNQARAHHTATRLPNGTVLVLGGTQKMLPGGGGAPAADVSLDTAEVFDPATGSFQPAGDLAAARDAHSATLLSNGTVLVSGGYSHGFDGDAQPSIETTFTAELLDASPFASSPSASLQAARAQHVATPLNDGRVLVTGGRYESQELCCNPNPYIVDLASAEVYE